MRFFAIFLKKRLKNTNKRSCFCIFTCLFSAKRKYIGFILWIKSYFLGKLLRFNLLTIL